jgi:hypothetical protein
MNLKRRRRPPFHGGGKMPGRRAGVDMAMLGTKLAEVPYGAVEEPKVAGDHGWWCSIRVIWPVSALAGAQVGLVRI